jgi:hypothetical protein
MTNGCDELARLAQTGEFRCVRQFLAKIGGFSAGFAT